MPPERVAEVVQSFLAHCRDAALRPRLLAFYGGSFTGLDDEKLERYLAVAASLVRDGVVHGLKASTRPDMVDEERLVRLRQAGFVELELGAQSFDDDVLSLSRRGHTAADTLKSADLIRQAGLRLGLQLMPGLPGEDRASLRASVDKACGLAPGTARIYPTVVLSGTELEAWHVAGDYHPLGLDEALERSLYAYLRLKASGALILRVGLPPVAPGHLRAGPYHPAFGFLLRARAYRMLAQSALAQMDPGCALRVHPHDATELLGHRRENQHALGFELAPDMTLGRGCLGYVRHGESACLCFDDIINNIL